MNLLSKKQNKEKNKSRKQIYFRTRYKSKNKNCINKFSRGKLKLKKKKTSHKKNMIGGSIEEILSFINTHKNSFNNLVESGISLYNYPEHNNYLFMFKNNNSGFTIQFLEDYRNHKKNGLFTFTTSFNIDEITEYRLKSEREGKTPEYNIQEIKSFVEKIIEKKNMFQASQEVFNSFHKQQSPLSTPMPSSAPMLSSAPMPQSPSYFIQTSAYQQIISFLQQHFNLSDDLIRYLEFKDPNLNDLSQTFNSITTDSNIKNTLEKDSTIFPTYFEQLGQLGDAALGYYLISQLAHLNIASKGVLLVGGQEIINNTRPYSFVYQNYVQESRHTDFLKYWGHWEYMIQQGYKKYQKTPEPDDFQIADYNRRLKKIEDLHQQGYLIGRVEQPQAVYDFIENIYHMGNDIMSTTLWPQHKSPLIQQLFCEHQETLGILLSPFNVGYADFGVSFPCNAGTVYSGFINHKRRREQDGSETILAQKQLFDRYQQIIQDGGSINDLHYSSYQKNPDGTYIISATASQSRESFTFASKNTSIRWNEATYYRGIADQMIEGLFLKTGSSGFSKELKKLFEVQDKYRQTKGKFLPIYIFNGQKNTLTEIVPDELMLNIVGCTDIPPVIFRDSILSTRLQQADITADMAQKMTKSLPTLNPKIQEIFNLQLLMITLDNIDDNLNHSVRDPESTYEKYVFENLSLINNLHLVFPTIFQTNNGGPEVKHPDWFFNQDEISKITSNPDLLNYLKASIRYNFQKFLFLTINQTPHTPTVTFDSKVFNFFDQSDYNKTDLAKVISRAFQCALLFEIFDGQTITILNYCILKIRESLPHFGITPSGVDMILGNQEIQRICTLKEISEQLFDQYLTSDRKCPLDLPEAPKYPILFTLDSSFDPFTYKPLPPKEVIQALKDYFGVELIDRSYTLQHQDEIKAKDPLLLEYEKALIANIKILDLDLRRPIMAKIKETYPSFGFFADGKDKINYSSDYLDKVLTWLSSSPKNTEFPFVFPITINEQPVSTSFQAPMGRTGRSGAVAAAPPPLVPTGRTGRSGSVHASTFSAPFGSQELYPEGVPLNKNYDIYNLIYPSGGILNPLINSNAIDFSSEEQKRIAEDLGMLNDDEQPIWKTSPVDLFFDPETKKKPKRAYLNLLDILGQYALCLLSGPAFSPTNLKHDQNSYELFYDDRIIFSYDLKRLKCYTLAVTTEGDNNVIRPNGKEYNDSHLIEGPTPIRFGAKGEHNDYHCKNELHKFRSDSKTQTRRFCKNPTKNNKDTHYGMGGYTLEELNDLEEYDNKFLNDEERRKSQAGIIASAYITVTAKGGYGSSREAFDKPVKVLYIETTGPHFERYGKGTYTLENDEYNEKSMSTESAVNDFIIKPGAAENPNPLFRHLYSEGIILSYSDASQDRERYETLKDNSLFNRFAYQHQTSKYLDNVGKIIQKRCPEKPCYLKAILFGGGFFAKANEAGDLRNLVTKAMINGYRDLIDSNKLFSGSVIEFPRYGSIKDICNEFSILIKIAKGKNIKIVWTPQGDVFEFSPQETLQKEQLDNLPPLIDAYDSKELSSEIIDLQPFIDSEAMVVLGAGDAMSWSGNERGSNSVEAAMANNSNLRLVMNWWSNPKILEKINLLEKSHIHSPQEVD